jgi:hypothetical protein
LKILSASRNKELDEGSKQKLIDNKEMIMNYCFVKRKKRGLTHIQDEILNAIKTLNYQQFIDMGGEN